MEGDKCAEGNKEMKKGRVKIKNQSVPFEFQRAFSNPINNTVLHNA
jgi:hypothetical protein